MMAHAPTSGHSRPTMSGTPAAPAGKSGGAVFPLYYDRLAEANAANQAQADMDEAIEAGRLEDAKAHHRKLIVLHQRAASVLDAQQMKYCRDHELSGNVKLRNLEAAIRAASKTFACLLVLGLVWSEPAAWIGTACALVAGRVG